MPREPYILLVEDSAGECELFRQALEQRAPAGCLYTCPRADAAFKFLTDAAGEAADDLPAVVVLDLNLPGENGRSLLRRLRADPRFTHLPIVMLTTSDDPEDVRACYAAGANGYVVKPATFESLIVLAYDLYRYWVAWNRPATLTFQC